MRERALAVLGAICLIAAAVLVRQWLADRSTDDPAPGGGGGAERPVVACTPDLRAVCDALAADGAIAAAPPDLDGSAAAAPDDEIDAWITWDPAPRLAGFDADGRTPTAVWSEVEVLATAPLAAAGTPESLAAACGTTPGWACLAEAGAAIEAVELGVGAPGSAEGSARLLPLARALSDDDDAATTDLVALRALIGAPRNGQRPAPTMANLLVTRPGEVEVVVGPQGLLDATASTAQARARGIEVTTPAPPAALAVVVAGRTEGAARRVVERCEAAADALAAVGLTTACAGGNTIDDGLAGFLWQVRKELR